MEWCSNCEKYVENRAETQDWNKYYVVDHYCTKCGRFLWSEYIHKKVVTNGKTPRIPEG